VVLPSTPAPRPLHPLIRNTLLQTGWVLLALGLDLTIFPTRTDEFFSWHIRPPLTAGAIGAFYVTAFVLIMLATRGRVWARTRGVILGGVVFAWLAIAATAIHFEKFAFDSSEPVAVFVAWVWNLSYAIVPLVLLVALIPQLRVPGVDPRTGRTPGWITATLAVAGGVMVLVSAALFVAPEQMAKVWPWTLTPLTARVLSSWMAGFGLMFAWAAGENDRFRVLPYTATLACVGLFQLLTAVRFGDQVSWGEAGAWIYVALMAAAVVAGGLGWTRLRAAQASATLGA
jgi:hypothetical protein